MNLRKVKKFHPLHTTSKISATCPCNDELKNSGTPSGRIPRNTVAVCPLCTL